MHSATKYMNGHTDVVMGLVATNREDVHEQLRFLQNGESDRPGVCWWRGAGVALIW